MMTTPTAIVLRLPKASPNVDVVIAPRKAPTARIVRGCPGIRDKRGLLSKSETMVAMIVGLGLLKVSLKASPLTTSHRSVLLERCLWSWVKYTQPAKKAIVKANHEKPQRSQRRDGGQQARTSQFRHCKCRCLDWTRLENKTADEQRRAMAGRRIYTLSPTIHHPPIMYVSRHICTALPGSNKMHYDSTSQLLPPPHRSLVAEVSTIVQGLSFANKESCP